MDSRVRYDGHTTFQGNGGTQLTYALVNGTGYMITKDEVGTSQTVECLRPGALSFNDILPALNDAVPIPSASIGDETIECTSGNIFKTTFAGAHFAICLSDKSGFKAYSSDIDIEVEYLENSVEVKLPVLGSGSSCEVVANPSSVTPITLALLTGSAISTSASRNLKAAEHMAMEAPSCKCKSTPRPCVFFHGNGNMNEMNELQDTPEKTNNRMGNMNDHTPCCTEVKYAVLNTRDNMWTNDSMQQKFCDYALQLSETSDVELGIIKDTVVVTHSMGGLIMSMALARGKCSFGEGSSWVAISTPTMGSMAADFLEDVCNDEFTVVASGLFKLLGKCPVPASRKSLVYQNEKYSTNNLNAAYRAAQEAYRGNVTAAMCSNDYNGIFSKYEAVLILAGKIFPHKSSENDGLVEYKGCALGLDESRFGSSYKDQFYKPELNHADTAFLTGDGYFKNSQKPVKWFECLL
ncbi:hypothetical protein ON010_g18443 [Phytophthora cinnamomi]|nr:hypothetical protein ON010_g18443 [Phytophthora cinnamomi]